MKAVKFSVAAAAALALSTAALAEGPVVYGQINAELGSYYDATSDAGVLGTRSVGSRLGVKGSKDLGEGLTAVYQIETGVDPVSATGDKTGAGADLGSSVGNGKGIQGDNQLTTRNSFVGIKGGFGTVIVGNHDTPYKIAARGAGTVAHTDAVDTLTIQDLRLKSAVAYIAPIEGMTLAAAIVPVKDTNRTAENDGMHMSLGFLMPIGDELKVAAGYESAYVSAKDVTQDNMFVAANFKMGVMTIGAAVETQSFDGEAMYSRVLVPFTLNMDSGLFVNAAVRNTAYTDEADKNGDGTSEAEMALGLSIGKKYGKDMEVYVGMNSYTAQGGKDGIDASDMAAGMRVYF